MQWHAAPLVNADACWSSGSHICLCEALSPGCPCAYNLPWRQPVVRGPCTMQLHPCLASSCHLAQVIHNPGLISCVSLISPTTQLYTVSDSVESTLLLMCWVASCTRSCLGSQGCMTVSLGADVFALLQVILGCCSEQADADVYF